MTLRALGGLIALISGCATFEYHGPTAGLGVSWNTVRDQHGNTLETTYSPYVSAGYTYLAGWSLAAGYGGRFDIEYSPMLESLRFTAQGIGCLLSACFETGFGFEVLDEPHVVLPVGFFLNAGIVFMSVGGLPSVEGPELPHVYARYDVRPHFSVDAVDFRGPSFIFGEGRGVISVEGAYSLMPQAGTIRLP